MAKSAIVTKIVFNKLPALGKQARRRAGQAVRKAALDIEAGAKDRAHVVTGAMKNSIQAEMTGNLSAEVAVGVEYGIYEELGTRNRPPHPFLGPAAEAVKPSFIAAMKQVLD